MAKSDESRLEYKHIEINGNDCIVKVYLLIKNATVMQPLKKCPHCAGEMIEKEVEKLLRGGNHTAVLNVTAQVCLHCGERLYTPQQVQKFAEVRRKLKQQKLEQFEVIGQSFRVSS